MSHPAEVPFEPEAEAPVDAGRETPAKSVDSSAMVTAPASARRAPGWYCAGTRSPQDFPGRRTHWPPTPLFAAVVAVDHRRHRIHPQRIDAETLDPVQRVPHREVADFTAAVVIDQRVPVPVIAFARVAVFIQRGAVKRRQGEVIRREVARHPVEDHVQAGGVRGVMKRRNLRGCRKRRVGAYSPVG